MRKAQSAVIVRIDLRASLERIRRTYVPVARLGVPAHVTILYPFVDPVELDAGVRRRLAHAAARTVGFDVSFNTVESFPDALYLAPTPVERFQVLSAEVLAAFPDLQPYGDPSLSASDLIPHLTIASRERGWAVRHIVGTMLPVRATVRWLTVIEEGPGGRWRTRWRVPLSKR